MVVAAHVDPDRAERGLRSYVDLVAAALHLGPKSAWCEWADSGNAYLALDVRLPGKPGRELALLWDAQRGWALAMETGSGEDLLVLHWYGAEVLPPPGAVARFVETALRGGAAGAEAPPRPRSGLVALQAELAGYADRAGQACA